MNNFQNLGFHSIYFIGIGGIGMSGLAEYLFKMGYLVNGCDLDLEQPTIKNLKNLGINIDKDGVSLQQIINQNLDLIVYTNTVSDSHPALIDAKKNNIKCITRAELLGLLFNSTKIIGVTGAHGKTSTTGLIAHILLHANKDPNIFVGGILSSINSNMYIGSSDISVIEADDAYRSFLTLHPDTSVVTSISYEHLETYKDMDDIFETFAQYVHQTQDNGTIIINLDTENMREFCKRIKRPYITYGLTNSAEYSAQNITFDTKGSSFDVFHRANLLGHFSIPYIGNHYVANALAAIIATLQKSVPISAIQESLKTYGGVKRRFEMCGTFKKAKVIDDYGHHPNEIENVLKAASLMCNGNLYVFFQPHKYSRTAHLWDEFIRIFRNSQIKKLFITDIFDACECQIDGVSGKILAETLSNHIDAAYIPLDSTFEKLTESANHLDLTEIDFVLCLGAGKLYLFAEKLSKL